jgi:drug/metabolite transporter (DMT)-like permease
MDRKAVGADLLLLLTACIWGFAFSAQRAGMDYIGPFTYNGVRFLLGSLSLIPLILFQKRRRAGEKREKAPFFKFIFAVSLTGFCLFIAASFQQIGIFWTTAGNSGFLTGIYVVLVPFFGIFLGKKTGLQTWIGALLAFAGLFFVIGGVNLDTINRGDILTAIGGVFWTCHVLLIDNFVKKYDALGIAFGQNLVCGILSLILAVTGVSGLLGINAGAEIASKLWRFSLLIDGLVPILYGGVCSVGIAYTLQIVAQKNAPPSHASIILCLESVFAAIGGILILHERPGTWTLLGFILMLSGMLSSQFDVVWKKKR